MTSEVIRFAPGLKPVLKHQRGKHDQAAHGAWAKGSGLREGWSQRSQEQVLAEMQSQFRGLYPNDREYADNLAEEFASWTTKYDGPNGTTVTVDLRSKLGGDTSPDPQAMDTALGALTRLQNQNPVEGLQVEFSDKPFRDKAELVPESASGFVIRGETKINLRPRYATDDGMSPVRDDGHFMPAAQRVSAVEYYLTHEYGHVLDTRSLDRVVEDTIELDMMGALDMGEMSDYGLTNDFEIFAESHAEWSLTNGKTDNRAAAYLADKYSWADNMQKAAGDDEVERIIIVDTFDAGNPPSIVKLPDDVLKHQQGGHDQKTHGRGSSVRAPFYDELEDSRRQAIEYLIGERYFPPSYSEEGVRPPTITISESFKNKVNAVRKKVKAWSAERERRELAEMTPSELAELAAANQRRSATREGPRSPSSWEGLVPTTWVNPFAEPAMAKAADNVLRILYRVFKDVVDEDIWTALVMDPRPLEELDGPLGELLDDMLDAVAPKPAVVKFAPGLRPVLKHQQGSHDQKTHGAWATGRAGGDFSEWGSRAPQIREIAEVAPPLGELQDLLAYPEDAIALRTDDLIANIVSERRRVIEESSGEQLDAMTREDGWVRDEFQEWLRESGGLPAFDSREEAETAFREFMRPRANFDSVKDSLSVVELDVVRSQAQQVVQAEMIETLTPGMKAVFEIEHPVTLPDGSVDVMEVRVNSVEWSQSLNSDRPNVAVNMDVYNGDGYIIAEGVQRDFRLGRDGKLEVENVLLKIEDDAYKGKGFATVFNERAYDAYISQGVESVTVGTAWDGGFVWANKGFAWDEASAKQNANVADMVLQEVLRDPMASTSTLERAATMLSDVQEQARVEMPDVSKMPTPMEIAMLGYRDRDMGMFGDIETTVWPGKTALYDARWKGRKKLTPENLGGIARSKAEMRRPQPTPSPSPVEVIAPTDFSQPSTPPTTEEIMELLQPIGKAKQLSYWDKIEQQAEFYEKWIMETGRGLEEEDPDSMDDFFAAAVEAMPWLVE